MQSCGEGDNLFHPVVNIWLTASYLPVGLKPLREEVQRFSPAPVDACRVVLLTTLMDVKMELKELD